MIDIKEIESYNKILKYAKGQYRSWDPAEDKSLKEAAPLLKFTLGKTIRQTEDRHINEILNYSTAAGASHVVITCNMVQFLVCYDSYKTLSPNYISPNAIHTNLVERVARYYNSFDYDKAWKIASIKVATYDRFAGVLPFDTKRDGLYILQNDGSFTLERNRKRLVEIYDQLGYVSRPGTPPTAVSPDEVTKQDMLNVLEVMSFCDKMGHHSIWTDALTRPLQKSIRNYRSLATSQHEKRISNIIRTAKGKR